jgi:solute carrier family 24 (sodium/potassium/calcium exchanger), member 6
MLNILLGIGIGGAWMMIQAANHHHAKHPDKPLEYKPYHIQIGGTLMVSAVTLLITLLTLLVVVPMNKWVLTRKIGWILITIWSVSTTINVIIEVTGVWSEIS